MAARLLLVVQRHQPVPDFGVLDLDGGYLFSPGQATRLFAFIAAGGSLGAIWARSSPGCLCGSSGSAAYCWWRCGGFLCVILLVHLLMREKETAARAARRQQTTLDHGLPGNPLRGFTLLFKSPVPAEPGRLHAADDLDRHRRSISCRSTSSPRAFRAWHSRTIAFADVDLFVNICSAVILIFGLGRVLQRFGVTASLLLTPILMAGACLAIALAPSLFLIQAAPRRASASRNMASPGLAREVLFTVVDQESKYKAKNVIDTTVYRFGDLTSIWMLAGLRAAGFGLLGAMGFGIAVSALWGAVAVALGRRYQALGGKAAAE